MSHSRFSITLCLTLCVTVSASGREATLLYPTEDTFIGSDVPDMNMGGMTSFSLGAFGKEGKRRGRVLLKFDPAAIGIPQDRPIDRVILRLNWRHFLWWSPDSVIRVHRVLRPWGQGTGKYRAAETGEVTWNSAQHASQRWEVAGCEGKQDRSVAYVERKAAEYNLDFDVTEFYTTWQKDRSSSTISFIIDADGAGQKPRDSQRKEYQAVLESSESTEAAGAALILVEGTEPVKKVNLPLWSHTCRDKAGTPSPAQFGLVRDGIFYGASYNGHVYKMELESGKLLADWNISPNGCYSAPLMVDNSLYVLARDKRFYRLEEQPTPRAVVLADYASESGTTRVESLAYNSTVGLFFLGTGSAVHAVDKSGKTHWSAPHANEQWGEPMACDGGLYVYDTKMKSILKYQTTGADAPKLQWKCAIGFGTAELTKGVDGDGETLIFVTGWKFARPGSLTAIHDSGTKAGQPKWGPINLPHTVKHCSVWKGHDLLLLPAQNGYVECRRASTGAFVKRIAILDAAEAATPWSQVVISGPYALVATHDTSTNDNYLYVYDIKSGQELWRSAAFDGAVGCMIPVVSNGIGVIGTYDRGTWHAFRLGEGQPVEFSRFANDRHNGQIPDALKRVVPHSSKRLKTPSTK